MLEAVAQLDRSLARVLGHVDVFASSRADHVVASLRNALALVMSTMQDLRERVLVSADDLAWECADSVLRARSAVIALQLAELQHVRSDVSARAFLAGRFRSVEEFSAFLLDEIGRVNSSRLREMRDLRQSPNARDESLQHVVIDNAEHALLAIGRNPDVEAFLTIGARVATRRFRIACLTIAAVLELPLAPQLRAVRNPDDDGASAR